MGSVGQILDVTYAKVPTPNVDATPSFTLPIGGLWQPNDWRICCFLGNLANSTADYGSSYSGSAWTYAPLPMPAGWISLARAQITGTQNGVVMVGHKMVAGDTDTEFSLLIPAGPQAGMSNFSAWNAAGQYGPPTLLAFTMRGADPTSTPVGAGLPNATGTQGPAWQFSYTFTYGSRSLGTTPGWEVFIFGAVATSVTTPAGWTDMWDNGFSFDNAVHPSPQAASMGLMVKKYASGSTSGSTALNAPEGQNFASAPPYGTQGGVPTASGAMTVYFKQAQDVTVSTGTAIAETDLANVATATLGASVIVPTGTATGETDLAGAASNGLTGYFVRDPYILGAGPVLDHYIRWVESGTNTGRASVVVKTSIDRMATWQVAANGGPIPGLRKGATGVDAVYAMATLTRLTTSDPMPKIGSWEPYVSTDEGRNELVETFTGLISAAEVEAGMDAGAGTGSGGSSSGIVSIGGGVTGGGRTISMKGSDLSRAIDLAGWNAPKFIAPGTNYNDAGMDMVRDRLPTQKKFDLATTTLTTPLLLYGVQPGAKPWKDIDELYMAIGWWAYFRADGTFRARPVPDPALGQAVWEYRDNISISNIKKSLTDQDFYNHIIVTGLATSPQTGQPVVPIRAESVDLDPVTGIYGKAGRRTYEVNLPAITSQTQGQTASDALLLRMKGCPELVTFTIPPNPLLEPGDIIAVTAPIVRASGNYVINGFDIPSAATRGQRVSCFRQSIAS